MPSQMSLDEISKALAKTQKELMFLARRLDVLTEDLKTHADQHKSRKANKTKKKTT